ncbi:MAG TPA: histidine kinase [Prolixibacteraceae bacterium]|nr:histidine kinase [Prolixibacteraceae bacterium]
MKILLVEDNLMNQKVVMFNLKKLDCEILAAVTGSQAIDLFKNNTFDLVLMDIMLPEMDGYEITAVIRKIEMENHVEKPVPIIALTANTYDNDKEKCFNAGMNDYLSKPFNARQLIEMIEKYMPQATE